MKITFEELPLSSFAGEELELLEVAPEILEGLALSSVSDTPRALKMLKTSGAELTLVGLPLSSFLGDERSLESTLASPAETGAWKVAPGSGVGGKAGAKEGDASEAAAKDGFDGKAVPDRVGALDAAACGRLGGEACPEDVAGAGFGGKARAEEAHAFEVAAG